MRDLSPYICLFPDCEQPLAMYSTTKQWLAHMESAHQGHSWSCQHCQQIFASEEAYRKHLADECAMTAKQINFLAQLSRRSALFSSCLFCEEDGESPDKLYQHMAQHLRSYALSSAWHLSNSLKSPSQSANVLSDARSEGAGSSIRGLEDCNAEVAMSGETESNGSNGETLVLDQGAYFHDVLVSLTLNGREQMRAVRTWEATVASFSSEELWQPDTPDWELEGGPGNVVATEPNPGGPSKTIEDKKTTKSDFAPTGPETHRRLETFDTHISETIHSRPHNEPIVSQLGGLHSGKSRGDGHATSNQAIPSVRAEESDLSSVASGIEAAGMIESLLSVLIKRVEGYCRLLTGRDINLLLESLKGSKIMFSNSIEYLLRSIVPVDELARLMSDPMGGIWREHDLDQRVIAHVGENAESMTKKLHDIYGTISRLQTKLPVSVHGPVPTSKN
jgi:hypothetical protein